MSMIIYMYIILYRNNLISGGHTERERTALRRKVFKFVRPDLM